MSRGSRFKVEWAPYAVEYLGTNKLPSVVTIDGEVGSGGEAAIYLVLEIPNALIKLYRTNDPKELLFREEKIKAMIKAKPQEPTPGHITFAWPLGMVYDRRGRFRGFVMPYIRCAVTISNFFDPSDYNWMDKFRSCGVPEDRLDAIRNNIELFRVGVALNLVKAVGYLHAVGHFVGDLNDRNVLVNSHGLVTLIDTDSFFIRDPDTGRIYPSEVGVGEYTAPEVLRGLIPPDRRSESTDVFSLSVIIFKLLMSGYHPFAGTVPSRESNTIEDNIRDCLSPYFSKGRSIVRKPIGAPNINSLPPELTNLFKRAFQSCDSSGRPSIEELRRVLENYYKIIKNKTPYPSPLPQSSSLRPSLLVYYLTLTPLSLTALSLLYLRAMPYPIAARVFTFFISLTAFIIAARLLNSHDYRLWAVPMLGELMLMLVISNAELLALAWSSIALISILLPTLLVIKKYGNANVGYVRPLALMILIIADALPGIALGQLYYTILMDFGPDSLIARILSVILMLAMITLLFRIKPFKIPKVNVGLKIPLLVVVAFFVSLPLIIPAYILSIMTWLIIATITVVMIRSVLP